MTYRVAVDHPVDLANGRVVEPGETVSKLSDDPHDEALVADGLLVEKTADGNKGNKPDKQPQEEVEEVVEEATKSNQSKAPKTTSKGADK